MKVLPEHIVRLRRQVTVRSLRATGNEAKQ